MRSKTEIKRHFEAPGRSAQLEVIPSRSKCYKLPIRIPEYTNIVLVARTRLRTIVSPDDVVPLYFHTSPLSDS